MPWGKAFTTRPPRRPPEGRVRQLRTSRQLPSLSWIMACRRFGQQRTPCPDADRTASFRAFRPKATAPLSARLRRPRDKLVRRAKSASPPGVGTKALANKSLPRMRRSELRMAARVSRRANVGRAIRRAGVGALPDFVPPQLTALTETAPEGGEWVHELKWDGYRMHARI